MLCPDVVPKAILFDMDGTLTEPMLDFPRMKSEMGIGDRPILEALSEMDPVARSAAETILFRYEEQAAACSTLNPGCHEVLAWLRERDIPLALITRNSPLSVATVLERHGLVIDVILTREDARPKPLPDALHTACRRLEVAESETWMVGDGQYDIEAGTAAGIRTVWVSHGREKPFTASPWQVVRDLHQLLTLLKSYDQRPAR
jgi:HAD superfamily hydrolase (TIGR01509 family)